MALKKHLLKLTGVLGRLLPLLPLLFAGGLVFADAASDSVLLSTKEKVFLRSGVPGFILYIDGWSARNSVDISAVDSIGKRIVIVPVNIQYGAPVAHWEIPIAYGSAGLHPGMWRFRVGGDVNPHALMIMVPVIVPPDERNYEWRMDVPAAERFDRELQASQSAGRSVDGPSKDKN